MKRLCAGFPRLAALVAAAAFLSACGEEAADETETPPAPPPAADLQQPTDRDTGLPDGGDIVRDAEAQAKETAEEIRRAAEEASGQAKREAEETVEQTRQQAEEQVEEVSQAARETMETYLGDLEALGETLSGVTSQFNAASAVPKAGSLIESLEASVEQLEQLAPEQFAKLKSMYADSLAPLVEKVQTEVNRLTSSDSFAALRPVLQDLPLLKP